MKHLPCYLLLLIAFSLMVLQPATAQNGVDSDKLNRYFTALEENDLFMGSVVVMDGDEVVFEEAYGIMSDGGKSATTESIYRIGSSTKSYTATMILQLVDQGELALDNTLNTYFPNMPNADKITIKQMLGHKSGLENFTNLPDFMEYYTDDRSRDEMLEKFESLGTSFEPGENTEYSNTGYALLGYIIEEVTEMSYADALQKMISEPLELNSTYYGSGINADKNEADSFLYQGNEWQPASRTNMFIPHGAGAIVSTAEDVAKFYHSLFNGGFLSDESLERMRTFDGTFGLGLIQFPFNEKLLVGHNGAIDGFQSNAAHYPGENLTFALLGNGLNYPINNILIGMLSISFGKEFEIPTFEERASITLDEDELSKYTGTYQSPQMPFAIEMFVENGILMARATGQGALPLTIYDEQTMGHEQAGIEIIFEEPEVDRYTDFELRQAGQAFQFSLEE